MSGSIKLGKPFGIQVLLHWSFSILLIWIGWSTWSQTQNPEAVVAAVVFIGFLFTCVVLHELGHALAARSYGIGTKSIVLLPIGGVANLEKIPADPKQELIVALAGPAVNVVIALFLGIILYITGYEELEGNITTITWAQLPIYLLYLNVIMVVFNMIPAFPMDGGRVLRALLSFRLPRVRATQIAYNIGKIFAILFVFMGLMGNPFLILIAVFIFLAARAEFHNVRMTSHLEGSSLRDVLITDFPVLKMDTPLEEAVKKLLSGQEERFIVMENGAIEGILTKSDIIKGISEQGTGGKVRDVMSRDVFTLDINTPLEEAYESVLRKGYSMIPVYEKDQLAGVLEKDNLGEFINVRAAMQEYQKGQTETNYFN